MERFIFLCSAILFFGISACKTQEKPKDAQVQTGPQVTDEPTVYKGVTDQNCEVEVAFGSYGSGIDGAALDKVMAEIDKKKLKYSSKNIGREGEVRICLPLNELKGKEKTTFIDSLKKIAKTAELVSVSIK